MTAIPKRQKEERLDMTQLKASFWGLLGLIPGNLIFSRPKMYFYNWAKRKGRIAIHKGERERIK